jgi:hypothetical protein
MSFVVPAMPLLCNIWRAAAIPPAGLPDVTSQCNLAWGRRVNVPSTGGTTLVGVPLMTMQLLLPAGTDIRGDPGVTNADVVEVPAGSGRYYTVAFVDDLGKGFANEHRGAILVQDKATWPHPTP